MQYSELKSLASLQQLAHDAEESRHSKARAEQLQARVLELLWDEELQFLVTRKMQAPSGLGQTRLQSRYAVLAAPMVAVTLCGACLCGSPVEAATAADAPARKGPRQQSSLSG